MKDILGSVTCDEDYACMFGQAVWETNSGKDAREKFIGVFPQDRRLWAGGGKGSESAQRAKSN